jgi:transcriptional regulator with XRE-family HTH domain
MTTWIENKRKLAGLSQEEVAESLGISRPTYVKIETGENKPTEEQKILLGKIFKMSSASVECEMSEDAQVEKQSQTSGHEIGIRKIPKENTEKFRQVLLYILGKIGSRPNIGQTVIYKLLYFIDFDYYEKYEEQLMGATYIKNTYGPTPVSFAKIVKQMESDGLLVSVRSKYFEHDQTKYVPAKEPNVSVLSGRELKHIDSEIERLAHLNAKQLSELSHKDTPWRIARERGILDYEYVFYRPEETSVREYESL